jgi:hypothetical protein
LPPRGRPRPAADAFSDLIGSPAAAPTGAPARAPVNTSDPFGDLLGTLVRAEPRGCGSPGTAASASRRARSPTTFDPFSPSPPPTRSATPTTRCARWAEGAVDLGGVSAPPPLSWSTSSPRPPGILSSAWRHAEPVDPHDAVDPLQMFGGDDNQLLGGRNEAIPAGALPMDDGLALLDGPFARGEAFPTLPRRSPPRRPSRRPCRARPRHGSRPPCDRPSHHRPSHHRPSHHRPSHHRPSHHRPSHHRPSHHRPSRRRPWRRHRLHPFRARSPSSKPRRCPSPQRRPPTSRSSSTRSSKAQAFRKAGSRGSSRRRRCTSWARSCTTRWPARCR